MKVLITGGGGFIGCNLTGHLIRAGHEVLIYDNLSRRGSGANLQWLRAEFDEEFASVQADVRDAERLKKAAADKLVEGPIRRYQCGRKRGHSWRNWRGILSPRNGGRGDLAINIST